MKKLIIGTVSLALLVTSVTAVSKVKSKIKNTTSGCNVSNFVLQNNSSPKTIFSVSTWNTQTEGENKGQTAGWADYFSLPDHKDYAYQTGSQISNFDFECQDVSLTLSAFNEEKGTLTPVIEDESLGNGNSGAYCVCPGLSKSICPRGALLSSSSPYCSGEANKTKRKYIHKVSSRKKK